MARLISRNHLPSSPLSFALGTHKLYVQPRQSFDSFYDMVVNFARANAFPVPSKENVESALCRQMGKGWCTSMQRNERTQLAPPMRKTGGCRTCGRR